jgi:hypothetical protein
LALVFLRLYIALKSPPPNYVCVLESDGHFSFDYFDSLFGRFNLKLFFENVTGALIER